ncbi:MAG: MoxR family ATPase, partial [Bacteroidota bacterium]
MMSQLPTGARALLLALQTPSPKGSMGIPVLLWGKPGVGKSSFIEALATEAFPVLTLIASIHDPTDFSGLPVFQDGKVHYAPPQWLNQFEEQQDGLLFLDELTTAPPAVQAALLRVVLERRVGFHPLPARVRIVAAANPPDLMVGGWELSPPLRNRFIHLQWDLPLQVYVDALVSDFARGVLPEIDPLAHA